jgi:hypothetical protein
MNTRILLNSNFDLVPYGTIRFPPYSPFYNNYSTHDFNLIPGTFASRDSTRVAAFQELISVFINSEKIKFHINDKNSFKLIISFPDVNQRSCRITLLNNWKLSMYKFNEYEYEFIVRGPGYERIFNQNTGYPTYDDFLGPGFIYPPICNCIKFERNYLT